MNKKQKIILAFLTILLVGAGVYWGIIRPANIRKFCDEEASHRYSSKWNYKGESYEYHYKRCLRDHGTEY